MNACALLVWDRRASKGGRVVFRTCGAPARYVVSISGDQMFATCHRHNARLNRAGVRAPVEERNGGHRYGEGTFCQPTPLALPA